MSSSMMGMATGAKCNTWPTDGYQTIFNPHESPQERSRKDGKPIVLGLQFSTAKAGNITSVRYYRSPDDKGTTGRTGRIYSWPDGQLLGSTTTFTDSHCAGGGWVSVPLTKTLATIPAKWYVVAIDSLESYPQTPNYLTKPLFRGDLTARVKGAVYGLTTNMMPKEPAGDNGCSNYWVDGKPNVSPYRTLYLSHLSGILRTLRTA